MTPHDAPDDDAESNADAAAGVETTRRHVAKVLATVSASAAVGGFAVDYVSALPGDLGGAGGPLYVKGTHLVDKQGNRLTAADALPAGAGKEKTVFPEKKGGGALVSKRATTLLLRFPADDYQTPTNVDGTAKGYVAYSKVCTHEGCLVQGRSGKNLHCPCHDSVYDPRTGASVVSGPAPRALPQLPLAVAKDAKGSLLLATGPFEGPIGPQG